jgi:putative ABC transport system ATP-binding protein
MVQVTALTKDFSRGDEIVPALRGVDLEVERGARIAIMGPSGGGKSTLLSMIGGLDWPTFGSVQIDGRDITKGSRAELVALRRSTVSMILQSPSLLPMLTTQENVELPMALNGVERGERSRRAHELLEQAGIADKADSLPEELSGGQQQRASVMRALANRPRLLLADEPAGSLDSETGAAILDLIFESAIRDSITLLMVTHDQSDASHADRIIRIKDGRIE